MPTDSENANALAADPLLDGSGANASGDTGRADDGATSTTETQAVPPTKRGRGRPPLSEEEKARRALERATRKAEMAGVASEIIAKYDAANSELPKPPAKAGVAPATPAVKPKKPPTEAQIKKAEKAISKSAAFLGGIVYELFTEEPSLEFKEEKADTLGEAWGDLLAEYLGENSGEIIRLVTAIGATGYVATSSVREVREHNRKVRDSKKPKRNANEVPNE